MSDQEFRQPFRVVACSLICFVTAFNSTQLSSTIYLSKQSNLLKLFLQLAKPDFSLKPDSISRNSTQGLRSGAERAAPLAMESRWEKCVVEIVVVVVLLLLLFFLVVLHLKTGSFICLACYKLSYCFFGNIEPQPHGEKRQKFQVHVSKRCRGPFGHGPSMRQSAATRLKLQNFDVQDEGASALGVQRWAFFPWGKGCQVFGILTDFWRRVKHGKRIYFCGYIQYSNSKQ